MMILEIFLIPLLLLLSSFFLSSDRQEKVSLGVFLTVFTFSPMLRKSLGMEGGEYFLFYTGYEIILALFFLWSYKWFSNWQSIRLFIVGVFGIIFNFLCYTGYTDLKEYFPRVDFFYQYESEINFLLVDLTIAFIMMNGKPKRLTILHFFIYVMALLYLRTTYV